MNKEKMSTPTTFTFGAALKKMDDPFVGPPKKTHPSQHTLFLTICRRLMGRESKLYPNQAINRTRKPPNKLAPATPGSASKDLFVGHPSSAKTAKFVKKCQKAKAKPRKGADPKLTAKVARIVASAVSPRRENESGRVLRPRTVKNYNLNKL